jgi:hypothetical protein
MAYDRENRRRYYLHRRIREKYRVDVKQRTIYVPYAEMDGIPEPYHSFCSELGNKKGYVVQATLQ